MSVTATPALLPGAPTATYAMRFADGRVRFDGRRRPRWWVAVARLRGRGVDATGRSDVRRAGGVRQGHERCSGRLPSRRRCSRSARSTGCVRAHGWLERSFRRADRVDRGPASARGTWRRRRATAVALYGTRLPKWVSRPARPIRRCAIRCTGGRQAASGAVGIHTATPTRSPGWSTGRHTFAVRLDSARYARVVWRHVGDRRRHANRRGVAGARCPTLSSAAVMPLVGAGEVRLVWTAAPAPVTTRSAAT